MLSGHGHTYYIYLLEYLTVIHLGSELTKLIVGPRGVSGVVPHDHMIFVEGKSGSSAFYFLVLSIGLTIEFGFQHLQV